MPNGSELQTGRFGRMKALAPPAQTHHTDDTPPKDKRKQVVGEDLHATHSSYLGVHFHVGIRSARAQMNHVLM